MANILKNLHIIVRCFYLYLIQGKADKTLSSPKSIIIIQRAKLGDMISTTPMFRAVKKVYPECRVIVVGNSINKKVLEGNPDVDEYIVWNDDVSEMVKIFKERKPDFGCTTSPNFHSLAALYLSGIKSISAPIILGGWSPYETRSYKIIRRFVIAKGHRMRHYVPLENLKLLEPLGIFETNTKKYIYWSKEAEIKINQFLSEIGTEQAMLVGVMPGAGNKIKQWPPERFSQIVDYLVEKYKAKVLIIGGETNRKEIEEMSSKVRNKESLVDCSWSSIDELKALIPRLDMTVSVDTGPIFIAEASDVPTIDIAGAIHPSEMAPNDDNFHLIVQSKGEPQIWTMNARVYDYEEARKQIESITVSMVMEKVDELMEKIRSRAGTSS
ncbi:glycosyltransferase family 9 protein [Candidatus Parcubacteria bacterium]|nr:glycosyltransferase family 9 protein [Candidatus Parcubacteria bacterium]